jgi:hypothetical protein
VVAAQALGAALGALLIGCGPEPDGFIELRGQWADGEAITFRESARLRRSDDGRVDLTARVSSRRRFLGARLSFDSARIRAPGSYAVDPAAGGELELYCAQPAPGSEATLVYDTIEYEVNEARVVIDRLPGANGRILSGRFEAVSLMRQGSPILRLTEGRFEGRASW